MVKVCDNRKGTSMMSREEIAEMIATMKKWDNEVRKAELKWKSGEITDAEYIKIMDKADAYSNYVLKVCS